MRVKRLESGGLVSRATRLRLTYEVAVHDAGKRRESESSKLPKVRAKTSETTRRYISGIERLSIPVDVLQAGPYEKS